jgi:hypothetical protein
MKIAFATGLILALAACSHVAAGEEHVAAPAASPAHSKPNGPTAVQIDANPGKWTGSYVRLSCEIIKVSRGPGRAAADARCGRGVVASLENYPSRAATKEYNRELGDQALLTLVGDRVSNFGPGQSVRIIGRVTGVATVRVDYVD